MKTEIIYDNKWVSLAQATLDNGAKYIYSTEPWCKSNGVAVLVYRWVEDEYMNYREYLGRYEICPAHSDKAELCAITGGCDKPEEEPIVTAVREVEEEAGYKVDITKVQFLGLVHPSKASDKEVFLYAVDVTGMEQGEAIGDGTLGEVGAYTKWMSGHECIFSKDPVLATMIVRQMFKQ
jgi:hypothetical protein